MNGEITKQILAKKAYILLMNEYEPRAKKLGLSLNEFIPPELAGILCYLECMSILDRRQTRIFLDNIVEEHKNSRVSDSKGT